jgi:hypothetical protein
MSVKSGCGIIAPRAIGALAVVVLILQGFDPVTAFAWGTGADVCLSLSPTTCDLFGCGMLRIKCADVAERRSSPKTGNPWH